MSLAGRPPAGAAPADAGAFADWVGPHLPAMARLAARLAPAADRDDVVQEALVRAWTKRRLYDGDRGTAAAWLLAITADQAAKARRRASSAGRPGGSSRPRRRPGPTRTWPGRWPRCRPGSGSPSTASTTRA